jgi:hypothetical protein
MNILPFVFAFILLFASLTLGFLRQHTHSALSETCLDGFNSAHRDLLNKASLMRYKKIKSAPKETPSPKRSFSGQGKKKTAGEAYSKRVFDPPLETSKLNLSSFFERRNDLAQHSLYEIAAGLLRHLYGETLFKKCKREGVEYELLEALYNACQKKEKFETLLDLYPDSPELKELFYKMLKGTNYYALDKQQGIPPLGDFVTLGKGASIYFTFASKPLVKALFGEKTALKILSEERKKGEAVGKKSSLTQEELSTLLSSDPAGSALMLELGQQLNFSQKFVRRNVLCYKNDKNDLRVRRVIH